MQAIQYVKSIPRWLLLRAWGRRFPTLYTSSLGLARRCEVAPPRLPTPRWVRVRPRLCGICGSDLATVTAKGSPFFSPLTSTPFVLGHEIVGDVTEVGSEVTRARVGDRVVVEPALGCRVRGIEPPCFFCAADLPGNCMNWTRGDLSAGIQTGYCRDTGGGWSTAFVAHESQLYRVPNEVADEDAVMVEPFSCALHAVLRWLSPHPSVPSPIQREREEAGAPLLSSPPHVLVLGCGTMGLLILAALGAVGPNCRITAVAKHPHQQEEAQRLGANQVVAPGRQLYARLCELSGAQSYQPEIGKPTVIGGFDAVFECVGASSTIDDALRFTRQRGQMILVGMPAIPKTVDWTTLWFKELTVTGTYAYGVEKWDGQRINTFDLALRLLAEGKADLKGLATHRFPLSDYREALRTALGKQGKAVKVVFDFTESAGD